MLLSCDKSISKNASESFYNLPDALRKFVPEKQYKSYNFVDSKTSMVKKNTTTLNDTTLWTYSDVISSYIFIKINQTAKWVLHARRSLNKKHQSFIDQSFVYTKSFQEYMSLFQQELTDHIAFDVSFSSK